MFYQNYRMAAGKTLYEALSTFVDPSGSANYVTADGSVKAPYACESEFHETWLDE